MPPPNTTAPAHYAHRPTARLLRPPRLYATDARASRLIMQELLRRQQTQAGTYTLPTS